MGEVVAIDSKPKKVLRDFAEDDVEEDLAAEEPEPASTFENEAAETFFREVKSDGIENFVILIHRKNGTFGVIPYLDEGLGLWDFVSAFKLKATEALYNGLSGTIVPNNPQRA